MIVTILQKSTKCKSFATDIRTQLASTDYGNFLANEPSPISTSAIGDKALKNLVDQFNYLKSNAIAPLDRFLDYITSVRSLDLVKTRALTEMGCLYSATHT